MKQYHIKLKEDVDYTYFQSLVIQRPEKTHSSQKDIVEIITTCSVSSAFVTEDIQIINIIYDVLKKLEECNSTEYKNLMPSGMYVDSIRWREMTEGRVDRENNFLAQESQGKPKPKTKGE